jgi:cell division protease FtsH
MEKETLDREEIARIFEPLKRKADRPAWTGSARRKPSRRPPVNVPPRVIAGDAKESETSKA